MISCRNFLFLLVVTIVILRAHAYILYMEGATTRCFEEHFKVDTKVLGEYIISDPSKQQLLRHSGDMKVDMTIRDNNKKIVILKKDINQGKFSFSTTAFTEHYKSDRFGYDDDYDNLWGELVYEVCFETFIVLAGSGTPQRRINIKFYTNDADFEDSDKSSMATGDQVDTLFNTVASLVHSVLDLHNEVNFAQLREQNLIKINATTYGKVYYLSAFSILLLVCITVFQTYYLKSFFKKKKLI